MKLVSAPRMPSFMPKTTPRKRSKSSPIGTDIALQVMIPERIKRQVSVRAAEEGTTQRTIVLTALRAIGFSVNDEDLCDKRKAR